VARFLLAADCPNSSAALQAYDHQHHHFSWLYGSGEAMLLTCKHVNTFKGATLLCWDAQREVR